MLVSTIGCDSYAGPDTSRDRQDRVVIFNKPRFSSGQCSLRVDDPLRPHLHTSSFGKVDVCDRRVEPELSPVLGPDFIGHSLCQLVAAIGAAKDLQLTPIPHQITVVIPDISFQSCPLSP